MDPLVLEYISKRNITVFSVVLPDGELHSATVHYTYEEEPLRFFIQTLNTTLKVQPFLDGETGKAALVIGFSEEDWLTLQIHGSARMVSDVDELESYYKNHPEQVRYKKPESIVLEFTPSWWRYTDFNTKPRTIISS